MLHGNRVPPLLTSIALGLIASVVLQTDSLGQTVRGSQRTLQASSYRQRALRQQRQIVQMQLERIRDGVGTFPTQPTAGYGAYYLPGLVVTGPGGQRVAGGYYVPGYGVTGPIGQRVVGGYYTPGYGVSGPGGQRVAGGNYVPGYGVTGPIGQRVVGGYYTPGYGVTSSR